MNAFVGKGHLLLISALLLAAPAAAQQIVQPPATGASAGRAFGGANLGSAQLSAFFDGSNVDAARSKGTIACEASPGSNPCTFTTGQYEILFARDISACAYAVSSANLDAIMMSAQPRIGKANGIFVVAFSHAGAGVNTTFHLTVNC